MSGAARGGLAFLPAGAVGLGGLHDTGAAADQAGRIGQGKRAARQRGERERGRKDAHGHGGSIPPSGPAVENVVHNSGKTGAWPFGTLPAGQAGAILCDPPWRFQTWSEKGQGRAPERHYSTMPLADICRLPVAQLAAPACVLFMWATWPMLPDALRVIEAWGFTYKTCGFDWMKAHAQQLDLFQDSGQVQLGLGHWTRANSEPCLLATRGRPRRLAADVRQGILEPRRQHSRKPDCVYSRIERLVAGPYVELFARTARPGWQAWGNHAGRWTANGSADL